MPAPSAPARAASQEKIIVALDVDSAQAAREVVDELKSDVGAFKIGLQLFASEGPAFVREIADKGVRIFLDLKFHDIPNTVAAAGVEAAKLGVWMFNVHALGGTEMMRATAETLAESCDKQKISKPKLIGVSVLTSSDANNLREVGIETDIERQVLRLAKLAADCSLDGVVASPHEAGIIRESHPDDFLIVTPGIRPKIATHDDQKRVMTPGSAVAAGSSYVVIGRPIMLAENRLAAVKQICNEVEAAIQ